MAANQKTAIRWIVAVFVALIIIICSIFAVLFFASSDTDGYYRLYGSSPATQVRNLELLVNDDACLVRGGMILCSDAAADTLYEVKIELEDVNGRRLIGAASGSYAQGITLPDTVTHGLADSLPDSKVCCTLSLAGSEAETIYLKVEKIDLSFLD